MQEGDQGWTRGDSFVCVHVCVCMRFLYAATGAARTFHVAVGM
jgi:hypothetical protein